jgi:hypothetical protein
MISPTEFVVDSIQAVAYVTGEPLRPASVLRNVLLTYGDVYDGEPISLPLPDHAPPEIPSVILSSQDNTLRLDVARTQVSLSWHRREGAAEVDQRQVYARFAEQLATITAHPERRLGRLGALLTRNAAIDHPGRALATQFCRDEWLHGPLNRPEGFELHAHKVFSLMPDLPVNSWIRLRTVPDAEQVYRYVTVQQDINTLVTEMTQRHFGPQQIASFLDAAAEQFDIIFRLYFPAHVEGEATQGPGL